MSDEAPLFFSLPIGAYRDTRWTRLDTDAEVGRIAELLAPFGFAHDPWPAAAEERGEDGVNIRLSDWNHRWRGRATIFYWVGHGFRDSERALLAHYFTVHHDDERDMHGVLPLKLSEVLRGRYGDEHPPPWTVMIIDACSSAAFVRELATHVTATRDATPTQLLLLGTSGDGETRLGEVSRHLAQTLSTHFARNDRIPVAGLIGQMVADGLYAANVISFGTLSGADLVRRQATAPVTAPLDLLADVEREINALGELERAHFVRPLHGGEAGDLSWYFTGRDAEQRRIAGWLRDNDHGLLAVAGHAGVGKSAILGHVLVQSRPPMRTVLARLGFDLTADEEQLPGDGVFTSTLLLTGFDRHSLAAALAEVGGLARPPLYNDPGRLARWLTDRLPPLTLLADALDQAREPEIVAGMLAQIARRGGIRVLVGTRRSAEILEELGEHPVLSVEYDESTVVEYVQDRLFRAFPDLAGPAALATARLVARRGRDFLFARLAVGELLERPGLLEDREALDGLLARGRSGIFADWLDRAGGQAPAIPRLLLALAYMRGRGLPSADGVWATVAGALTTGPPLTTADIAEAVQRRAAGFLVADVENGTTVYRLAHTVYEDVLRERHGAGEESAHLAIVRALLQATGGDGALAPYSRAYLSAHAAAAGRLGWNALAERPRVLDRLDGVRLRTDLIRDALGHNDLPPEIVGAVGAGHLIATADPADRRGIREVAMARYAGTSRFGRNVDGDTWSVRSAWLAGETAHLTVGKAGGGMVNALTTFLGPRGTLLASAGDEGSVRLIDPVTGQQVDRLSQPGGAVWALTAAMAGGRNLLASGGDGGLIRFWDPKRHRTPPGPLAGHAGRVRALAAFTAEGRRLLASGGDDKTLRIWDLDKHEPLAACPGHDHWVMAVVPFTDADGRALLATASRDKTLRIWDALTGEPLRVLSGHTDWVYDVATFPGRGRRPWLASAGGEGCVRIWDPATGREVREPLRAPGNAGHRAVHAVTPFIGADGTPLLASGGDDKMLRIWDPVAGVEVLADSQRTHRGGIRATAVLTDQQGLPAIASAGHDRVVRIWDPSVRPPPATAYPSHGRRVTAIGAFTVNRRPMLATGGSDRRLRIWAINDPEPPKEVSGNPRMAINAILPGSGPSGARRLVTAGSDGTVRMWDPVDGSQVGDADWRHHGEVLALAGFRSSKGHDYVVSGSSDGWVAFWTLSARGPRMHLRLRGHDGRIRAAAVFRSSVNGRSLVATGGDDVIRIWDPVTREEVSEPIPLPRRKILCLAGYRVGETWLLAAGMRDGAIRVVDPSTRSVVTRLPRAHSREVTSLITREGPDGRRVLVSGGLDRTLRLWDPLTLAPLATLPIQVGVTGLATVDGGIAVASTAGVLLVDPGTLGVSPTA